MSRVIAVIPAYNEATRIESVVKNVLRYVDTAIVVDDGSSDATGDVAAKAGAVVVTHRGNCGAGAATMTGIEAARRMGVERLITIDADEQHDPQDIPPLLKPLEETSCLIMPEMYMNLFSGITPCRQIPGKGTGLHKVLTCFWLSNGIFDKAPTT